MNLKIKVIPPEKLKKYFIVKHAESDTLSLNYIHIKLVITLLETLIYIVGPIS